MVPFILIWFKPPFQKHLWVPLMFQSFFPVRLFYQCSERLSTFSEHISNVKDLSGRILLNLLVIHYVWDVESRLLRCNYLEWFIVLASESQTFLPLSLIPLQHFVFYCTITRAGFSCWFHFFPKYSILISGPPTQFLVFKYTSCSTFISKIFCTKHLLPHTVTRRIVLVFVIPHILD